MREICATVSRWNFHPHSLTGHKEKDSLNSLITLNPSVREREKWRREGERKREEGRKKKRGRERMSKKECEKER